MNKTLIASPIPVNTWSWLKVNSTTISVPQNVKNNFVADYSGDAIAEISSEKLNKVEKLQGVLGAEVYEWLSTQTQQTKNLHFNDSTNKTLFVNINLDGNFETVQTINIYADKNCNGSLVLNVSGKGSGFVSVFVKAYLEENSKVNVYQVQTLDYKYTFVSDFASFNEKNAEFNTVRLNLGASESYVGLKSQLNGKKSNFVNQTGYLLRAEQTADIQDIVVHEGMETTSQNDTDGVLLDKSKKTYRGTIDLVHGCTGSNGREQENIIILSDDAINKTVPIILCGEDDVEGNHGATIGKLDDDILFYMQTRGLCEVQAKTMLIESKLGQILNKVPNQDIVDSAKAYIKETLEDALRL